MAGPGEPQAISRADDLTWRPLRVLCAYRLALAALLVGGYVANEFVGTIAEVDSLLFGVGTALYIAYALAALLLARAAQGDFNWVVRVQLTVDVVLLGVLIHASGGPDSGLGVLMLVAVAGGSLLTGVKTAAFFAALGTVTVLGQRILHDLAGRTTQSGYTELGLLGVAMFVTALGGALLARRARYNAELAHRRGVDVANLEALNAHIVQRMGAGVVALDPHGRCRLVNGAAMRLLGLAEDPDRQRLAEVAPVLAKAHRMWMKGRDGARAALTDATGGMEFEPRFQSIGVDGAGGTLIFLENLTEMRAQVQEAKLASLGRLTASIAHEIRNPLAAMLQANQLLGEASYLEPGEQRLVGIIAKQGRRLNKTVDNVLQLSRRAPPERDTLTLDQWLSAFRDDWLDLQGRDTGELEVTVSAEAVAVHFDRHHLEQVLSNLLRNAREHAGRDGRPAAVELRARPLDGERAVLEVRDNGPGLAAGVRAHLFEPFVTGAASGTGLGLYLSRELCEANQARIDADNGTEGGAVFRLTLARARSSEAA